MPRLPTTLLSSSRSSCSIRIRCPAVIRPPRTFASTSAVEPTIFAPATGRGKTAISILRISGPDALNVWRKMTKPPRKPLQEEQAVVAASSPPRDPPARRAMLRRIVHPTTDEVLDEGIVLYFPANSALTAQPTLELHIHGSPALMELLLQLLPTLPGSFRIAEPGEFTRLAFEAGKMDLTEVEGLRDLVEADTEAQRKLAARQAGGQMRKSYDAMRASIIEATSLVEALIDFGEDEGISEGIFEQARDKVQALRDKIKRRLADGRRGEIIRSGIHLAIIGAPNAGKSSLLNWLAQREAAIVTSTPGTTRDVVELSLNYHGFPIIVADTAGLRATKDEVEAIGIERALMRADTADIKLCVLSLPKVFADSTSTSTSLEAQIDPLTLSLIDSHTLVLLNKVDALHITSEHLDAITHALRGEGKAWLGSESEQPFWQLSVRSELGLREFAEGLKGELQKRFDLSDDVEDTPLVTHARHRRHLEECETYLSAFLELDPDDIVLAAEELRYAVLALGRITGAVDVEEILGEIFSGFCIGK
ncbi:tRNA modification GTPase TrmE [Leucosporidium creatinivorum]|uniref:tRNA modification GTPase TrmE n=1 Tax=Leucosporidium creatinivorum TaxID=106004 RepID=A0A1Y2F9X4_9BASI|nr:tRNA modification GTPase TrmE [Leucosporidium creatinivorum]